MNNVKIQIAQEMLLGGVITNVEMDSTGLIVIVVYNQGTRYCVYPQAVSRIDSPNNKELSIDKLLKKHENKQKND